MTQRHFCTTTYIFNQTGTRALLIRHKKTGFYLPPGGHIDQDEDYFVSSKREVEEELGIKESDICYPEYLHSTQEHCLQPWGLQRYTIKPKEHFHYDLLFVGLIEQTLPLKPRKGESEDLIWFDVAAMEGVDTIEVVKANIRQMSAAIQSARARETVQQNLYLWPRYDESLQKDLAHFTEGHSFGSWTLGDLYDEVPGAFARKMGLKYGLFASTGTAGLHAVLMALGLQPGDEVIVPSMTFIRAASPLTHLSLQPVIADVDKDTGLIDPVSIEANITPKTRAVIMVHMWGLAADCQKISRICKHHDLLLIEDFSQAHFSRYKNKYVGSFGDASFASLQRKKCISVGEGGIVVTRHKDVFERLKKITAPGSFDSDFAGYGLNMRMSPFSAVAVKNLLPKVETFIRDKQAAVHNMVPLLEQQPELLQPMTIPSYLRPEDISWYAYKPTLNHATLKKLQQKRLWKFGELGYGNISQDQYWKGDERYFPFSLGIRAVVRTPLPGHAAYIKDRITLNIPTVPAEYWDEAHINSWKKELGV